MLRCQIGRDALAERLDLPGAVRICHRSGRCHIGSNILQLPADNPANFISRGLIVTNLGIAADDFESVPFNQRGGLGKVHQLFGVELSKVIEALNGGLTIELTAIVCVFASSVPTTRTLLPANFSGVF